MAQLEEIAAVEGVDALFVGPGDLSAAMGHIGNIGHPDVQAAIADAARRARAIGNPSALSALRRKWCTLSLVTAMTTWPSLRTWA
ncbi:MAG: aldolase/citrate lyase family protein [Janthinobacterium sp.]